MPYNHQNATKNRWQQMTPAEQMANLGAEVGRTAKWQRKDEELFNGAMMRALELFNLSLEDSRWQGGRLLELGRLKEVFCDAVLGGKEYGTDLFDLERYFYPFMNLVAKQLR